MNVVDWSARVARGPTAAVSAGRVRLFAQIKKLSAAPDECFATGYDELIACLERQLRNEEALMEASNSRALRSYQEEHARVLAALHQAEPRVDEGNLTLGREALALLDHWLPLQCASIDVALLKSQTSMGRQRPLESGRLNARRRRRPTQPDDDPISTA
jgi:hemerythrin